MRMLFSILVFISFLISCQNSFDKNKPIAIQPYKGFDSKYIESIQHAIESVYEVKTLVLNEKEIPKSFFINIKSPRYRADSIIKRLNLDKPDSTSLILGITHLDISTSKKDSKGKILEPISKYSDWGIFGLGYVGKPGCVISSFRIKNVEEQLFISRLQKISVHELGHNMGLKHCETERCVMQDAVEKVSTVDNCDLKLCEKCKAKLN